MVRDKLVITPGPEVHRGHVTWGTDSDNVGVRILVSQAKQHILLPAAHIIYLIKYIVEGVDQCAELVLMVAYSCLSPRGPSMPMKQEAGLSCQRGSQSHGWLP